ncbi:follistatin-A isoform X2 [Neodiprion virginianus]|uniref:follistatin-A isoform X2 n=1 Tax=Neodiprion virginianus TaxID=2961670 RepID=UPI001EE6B794|nr:follistatin-A isoform X2 [Neodiprion virginianus]
MIIFVHKQGRFVNNSYGNDIAKRNKSFEGQMRCDNKEGRALARSIPGRSCDFRRLRNITSDSGAAVPSGFWRWAPAMTALRRGRAKPRLNFTLLLSLLAALLHAQSATGGICWSSIRNGRCTELLAQGISRKDCCASNTAAATAYSDEDLDSGTLFFWRVLGGGVPCRPCRETCTEVRCEEGKKCIVRRGRPRCVCNSDCKAPRGGGGPVCGTDGRSYRSLCRLKKRACRKDSHDLAVAYNGHCQSSCTGVRCGPGRSCLLDQNLSPHCVKCARRCPAPSVQGRHGLPGIHEALQAAGNRPVCGADGNTYKSACHLRLAACRAGRAIPIAYKGRCKQAANCSSIRCREGQTCLTEMGSGRPRCVTCSYRCPRRRNRNPSSSPSSAAATPQYCASNNITYPSWCHIVKDACLTGFVLETLHPGPCNLYDAAIHMGTTRHSLTT